MTTDEVFDYPKGWKPVTSGLCRNGDCYLRVDQFVEGRVVWMPVDPEDYDTSFSDFDLLIRKDPP